MKMPKLASSCQPAMLGFTVLIFAMNFVPARADRVDDYVHEQMRSSGIPGLSLAVIEDGVIVKVAGFGLANVETGTAAVPGTVYKTASLSKPVLAAAIMLLVQDGKLALDDKASMYLEGSPPSWKDITVRHLLSHTSGIVRDPTEYRPYEEPDVTDIIASVYSLPLSFQPGEQWLYSNVGYYVLAEIISQSSGQLWSEFIAKRLFAPAGMTSTRTTTTTEIVPQRASGYTQKDEAMLNAEDWIAVRPSGAFLSTVLDMAKWDALENGAGPLTPSSREQMRTAVMLNDNRLTRHGLGWYVESLLGHRRIHHDGQFPGFRSAYERFEDDKLTVIVLANLDNKSLQRLAVTIAGFYVPGLTAPRFSLNARSLNETAENGEPVEIGITARAENKAAPDSVVEIEVFDAADKLVHKHIRSSEDFAAEEVKTYTFSWTPTTPGVYTVNAGVYGPRWILSYAWQQKIATIAVE